MSRTNQERTEQTQQALIAAARGLFIKNGYADTATPDIAKAAGVTRGALYHHFADKRDLFYAVIVAEGEAVAEEISRRGTGGGSPRNDFLQGVSAYFDAMAVEGRTKLMLLDAPAVIGRDAALIDGEYAEMELKIGLDEILPQAGALLGPLTNLLSAAFERAAVAIDAGADRQLYERSIEALIDGLADQLGR